jgi:hypothetical protein
VTPLDGPTGSSVNGSEHPEFLGAYVLGLVDDDERAAIEAHLDSCAACRADVAELSGLGDVLAGAPPAAVLADLAALEAAEAPTGAPRTDDLLLQRTLREMRRETGRSRRLRLVGAAAAVVAVAGLAGVGGAVIGSPEDRGTTPPIAQEPGRTLTTTDAGTGVELTARIIPANAWTRLNVSVKGATDGRRDVAGSWVVAAPRPGARRGGIDGSTSIAPDELAGVEIVDGTGKRLVGVSA